MCSPGPLRTPAAAVVGAVAAHLRDVFAHQRANAMLAEVLVVSGVGASGSPAQPRVIAWDGRVEYGKPHIRFLDEVCIVARLNLVIEREDSDAGTKMGRCSTAIAVKDSTPPPMTHGTIMKIMRGFDMR